MSEINEKDLHEAAKKLYKDKGHITLAGDKDDEHLVAGEYGVHGAIGFMIFGTDLSSKQHLLNNVASTLRSQGYLK